MTHPYRLDEADQPYVAAAGEAARAAASAAPEVDREARFPAEGLAALKGAGLMGLTVAAAQGGRGRGMRAFAGVVEELAGACASTAMVYVMHVSATQAIASSRTLGERDALLAKIASGGHLTTLAFSEAGSRSHFWAPMSELAEAGDGYRTSAKKSWVTSANHADSYVSSARRPGAASALESTIYLVGRRDAGVRTTGRFDGLGLRGNDSAPVELEGVAVRKQDLISEPGAGAATMLEVVLPWFVVGSAAMAAGLCRAAVGAVGQHLTGTRLEHLGQALRDLPGPRARIAQMSVRTEEARALLGHAIASAEAADPAAALAMLQARRSALDAALHVTDLAMKAGGGAAFSRQLPLERLFRDARAGWVMAPTVDHLDDFIGKALTGLPLF